MSAGASRNASNRRRSLILAGVILLAALGCRTPHFPPVDLSSPARRTWSGQAIWKPDAAKPEIVGDLVVSLDAAGHGFLQFSKALPIATAHLGPQGWQIEFPPQNRHYAAPGRPPKRIAWLQWLSAWSEVPPKAPWQVTEKGPAGLTLVNEKSGERIEAHF